MRIKNIQFLIICFLCIINLLTVYGFSSSFDILRVPLQMIVLILFIFDLFTGEIIFGRNKRSDRIIATTFAFIIVLLLYCLASSENLFNNISNSIFGLVCFLIFTSESTFNIKLLNKTACVAFLCISGLYVYYRLFPTANYLTDYHAQYVNSIYYIICILPFMLCTKYDKISLFVTLGCVAISDKQGAFVALIVGGLLFLLSQNLVSSKKINRNKIYLLFTMALMFSILYYTINFSKYDVLKGFRDMQDDEGNGRFEIYGIILQKMSNSDIVELLLGHGGINAVSKNIGISAHNDFLETLYDFGIVGFGLYITFIWNIILLAKRLYFQKNLIIPAYIFAIIAFFSISSVSHIFYILKYNMLMFSFLGHGIYMGRINNRKI